ncbi:hypothetical protein H5410_004280 [Solanum commersonii]|uniref:Uncharacterized protein n=1 Tax=Solanum commersonii TaxID=4109 RepID=A0A9J6B7J2_SOLCO|nr:hypothetical protein H5410_004280 [Solanum commersonii]
MRCFARSSLLTKYLTFHTSFCDATETEFHENANFSSRKKLVLNMPYTFILGAPNLLGHSEKAIIPYRGETLQIMEIEYKYCRAAILILLSLLLLALGVSSHLLMI